MRFRIEAGDNAYSERLVRQLQLQIKGGIYDVCNGWCFTWGVTAVGGTHVCLRKVDPAEIFRLIERENVSHMCGAPIVLIGMSNYAQNHNVRLERPLKIATGGAPPSPAIIEQMESIEAAAGVSRCVRGQACPENASSLEARPVTPLWPGQLL